uniref:Uncharacterized protein n=1 Tax=Dunaliella tertiolecta TaxID=3047 RepID=A0A7S3VRY3_DUNTE
MVPTCSNTCADHRALCLAQAAALTGKEMKKQNKQREQGLPLHLPKLEKARMKNGLSTNKHGILVYALTCFKLKGRFQGLVCEFGWCKHVCLGDPLVPLFVPLFEKKKIKILLCQNCRQAGGRQTACLCDVQCCSLLEQAVLIYEQQSRTPFSLKYLMTGGAGSKRVALRCIG